MAPNRGSIDTVLSLLYEVGGGQDERHPGHKSPTFSVLLALAGSMDDKKNVFDGLTSNDIVEESATKTQYQDQLSRGNL